MPPSAERFRDHHISDNRQSIPVVTPSAKVIDYNDSDQHAYRPSSRSRSRSRSVGSDFSFDSELLPNS
jgi:hypothetical protein